jgi:RNA polymerase sigma-70 factor (ECF subfamily)
MVTAETETLPVEAARAGDPAAWDALFRRYQLPLYAYVFELVRDEQISLDIVQESFISAVRHLHRLRDDAKFGSWLFSIAHQKCIHPWRRRGPELLPMDEVAGPLPTDDDSPSDGLIRQEQAEELMNCLNQLTPPHRAVLLLHFLEEFSLGDIAEITGTEIGTVKSRMHYAKKALRQLLESNS